MMETLTNQFLNVVTALPSWAFWIVFIVILGTAISSYLFPSFWQRLSEKTGFKYSQVDAIVKSLGMLAVRMYVIKQSIDESRKVEDIKAVNEVIQHIALGKKEMRLSELVDRTEVTLAKLYLGDRLLDRIDIIRDIQKQIVKELIKVGSKVNDNEKDPMVNPQDVVTWINKGVKSVKKL